MSGGSFNYNCFKIAEFAEDLAYHIKINDVESLDGWKYGFGPTTISALHKSREIIYAAGQLAHAIEWLYSGDYGEDTFLKEVERIKSESCMFPLTLDDSPKEGVKNVLSQI